MSHAEDKRTNLPGSPDGPVIRWRPWPCKSCRGSANALGFLSRSIGADAEIEGRDRNHQIELRKKRQADRLLEWVQSCPHTTWSDLRLPKLKEGSEHLVLFDETRREVVKVTLPGTYGDYYEIIEGRVYQFDSTPAEYLLRMRWWERLFSTAPAPLGMMETGQIVSRQKFIEGDPEPPQDKVDQFLTEAGAVAVKPACWLWKKVEIESRLEVWIGDARSDNFVLAEDGIIPIDIRIWGVPIPGKIS